MHYLLVRNTCGEPRISAGWRSQKRKKRAPHQTTAALCHHTSESSLRQTPSPSHARVWLMLSGNYANSLGFVKTAVLVKRTWYVISQRPDHARSCHPSQRSQLESMRRVRKKDKEPSAKRMRRASEDTQPCWGSLVGRRRETSEARLQLFRETLLPTSRCRPGLSLSADLGLQH